MTTGAADKTVELSNGGDAIERGGVTRLQILILFICLVLNMLDGFDVTVMSYTAHSIGEQLGIAPDKLGIVFSAALIGMIIGSIFLAPLSDVIGRRRMMLISVSTIGVSMYLTGYASTLWHLIIFRAFTGLGVGGLLATVAAFTSEYTPGKYRAMAVVSVTAGFPLGASLGGFLAAPMIAQYGWETAYFAGGIAALFMVLAVYFWIPESLQFLATKRPPNALDKYNRILARLNKTELDALPEISEEKPKDKASVVSLLTRSRWKKTISLWSAFLMMFLCAYFLLSWLPKLVVNAGLSESEGIYASVALNGGGVLGIIILGWLSANIAISKLIGGFISGAGISMIIFALASGIDHLVIYLFFIGFLLHGGVTAMYAVGTKMYPTEVRATGVGWAIGVGRIGAVISPFIGGILIAMGVSMEINFIIFAIPLLIGGFLAYSLRVR